MISLRVFQSGISTPVSATATSLPMGSSCLRAFGGDLLSFGGYQVLISWGSSQVVDHLEGNQPKRNLSKRDDNANSNYAFSIEGRKSMEEVLRYSPQ